MIENSTRVQLSLRMDEYSDLLEKVKKYCKLKKLTLTGFVAMALENALQEGVESLSNKTPPHEKIEALEDKIESLSSEQEITCLRLDNIENQLRVVESSRVVSSPTIEASELVKALNALLDPHEYPTNNAGKLRRKLTEIISQLVSTK